MNIPRPDTTDEMVLQLWFAIIGSNGDGLATKIKDTAERVERIETTIPTLMTRAEHEHAEDEGAKKRERRRMRPVDRINIGVQIIVGLFLAAQTWAAVAAYLHPIVQGATK